MNLKDASAYRRAAKYVSCLPIGCCHALFLRAYDFTNLQQANCLHSWFDVTFKPNWEAKGHWYGVCTEENQLARSLALLFMAEIAEEESK